MTRSARGAAATQADVERMLREAFAGPAWHGPSLRGALRGVRVAEALWQPGPGRNRIWDLALHTAYAKLRVLRRLDAEAAGRFPRRVDRGWWPRLPEPADAAAWAADLALLDDCHRRLVEAVGRLSGPVLAARRSGKRWTLAQEATGITLHDVYHAGQIRLMRRLFADRRTPGERR